MILAVAGIRYLDETYALITNEIKEKGLEKSFIVEKYNLTSSSKANNLPDELGAGDPNQDVPDRTGEEICIKEMESNDVNDCRILVLTDRDCTGVTIRPDECLNKIKSLTSRITSSDFVIVNVDDSDLIRHIEGIKCRVVTFGFNSKARVTASSTGEDVAGAEYLCSLQSSIKSIYGNIIEPGEVKILDKMGCKEYSILAYCSFLLISEIKKPGD